jgi:Kef-type K+ transport system membrane component KefB
MSAFVIELSLFAFIIMTWLFSLIASHFHISLIGELLAGCLLGPGLADIVPSVSSWQHLGNLALCGIIFDGSLSLSFDKLRAVGWRALIVAFVGTVCPVGLGFGIMTAFGYATLPALSCGVALASTAIGSAAILLQAHGIYDTELGWLIASAALLDDVFSLVLLTVVSQLGATSSSSPATSVFFPGTQSTALLAITPVIASAILLLIGLVLALFILPAFNAHAASISLWLIERPSSWFRHADSSPKVETAIEVQEVQIEMHIGIDQVSPAVSEAAKTDASLLLRRCQQQQWMKFLLSISIAVALAYVADALGTSVLFGVFIAGSSISSGFRDDQESSSSESTSINQLHAEWLSSCAPLLARIFYGSIGLIIPTSALFRASSLWMGLCLSVVGLLGKWITGVLFERDWTNINVVGFSMVNRGDLGFLLARTARYEAMLLDDVAYSAVVWSLIVNTCIGPIAVAHTLKKKAE